MFSLVLTVTYINTNGVIEVNGVVYTLSGTTVLKNQLGITELSGMTAIAGFLNTQDTVFDIVADSNIVISSLKYNARATGLANAQAVIDEINALDSTKATFVADVAAARVSYNAMGTIGKNLVPASVLAKLVAAEAQVTAADQAAATAFKADAAVAPILAKTLATITAADDVDVAITKHDALTPAAQALVTTEKALLDSLKVRGDAISAVNAVASGAGNEAAMKAAIEDAKLGLDLSVYNTLVAPQKALVIAALTDAGRAYTDTASVQAALDAQL